MGRDRKGASSAPQARRVKNCPAWGRLIRYDFAQTPEMLRRLWYAYYIPMLLIPTLALYTLFFLDRGQSAPLYKYR